MEDLVLLEELVPTFEKLLDRHFSTSKEWFPHELVPWSMGRDFEPNEEWDPNEFPLPPAVRSALFVNLLTEDNLPHYFATINRVFSSEAWSEWTHRWTAEEGRHSIVIRDYLTVTRAIDPIGLEKARMAQVSRGKTPQPPSVQEALAYLTLQELATRISHRNTGKLLEDKAGYSIMARVGSDENFHHLFYRDLATASIEINPSEMVIAIEKQVRGFQMPGIGIPGFNSHAKLIAKAGIYDFESHHSQILVPLVIRHWKIDQLENLSPEAEKAREKLLKHIDRVALAARHVQAHREEDDAKQKTS